MAKSIERPMREMEAVVPRPRTTTLAPNQGGMAAPVPGKPSGTRISGEIGGRPPGTPPMSLSQGVPGHRNIPAPDPTIQRALQAAQQGAGGEEESPVPGMSKREYDRKMANSPGFRAKYGPGGEVEQGQQKEKLMGAFEGAMGVTKPLAGGGSVSEVAPGRYMTQVPGSRPSIESQTPMSAADIDNAIKTQKVGKVTTPAGVIEADEATGKKKWQPSPQAMKVIEEHRDKVMASMNFPGKGDPNAPKPPIMPGIPFFNPFSGTFEGGDTPQGGAETSLFRTSEG